MRKFHLYILLLLSSILFAQSSPLNWEQTNGPYGGNVSDIKRDSKGKLWISTSSGIYTSNNNGESWTKLSYANTGYSFAKIIIHESGKVFALGSPSVYSDANGANWMQGKSLKDACYKSTKILGIDYKKLYVSSDTAKTWKTLYTFEKKLQSVFMLDDSNYIVASDSGIYTSRDSGKIWNYKSLGVLRESQIVMDSKKNIYLVAFVGLFVSSDGGNNWTKMKMPPNIAGGYNFYYMYIDKNDKMFLACSDGLLVSDDYGKNWKSIWERYQYIWRIIEDEHNNLICATSDGVYKYDTLLKKTIEKNYGINSLAIYNIFVENNRLFTETSSGFFKSPDNGSTWERINSIKSMIIGHDNYGRIYAGTLEKIKCTEDDGVSWTDIMLPVYYSSPLKILSINETTILVLTYEKVLYRSTDMGKNWQIVWEGDEYLSTYDLIQSNNKTIYFSCNNKIYKSNDEGLTWLQIGLFESLINSLAVNPYDNIIVCATGLFINDLSGWREITVPWQSPYVQKVEYSKNGDMFILGSSLHCSSDNGRIITELYNKPYGVVTRSFAITEDGYIFIGTQERGLFKAKYEFSDKSILPDNIVSQNFPNPFNGETNIEYINNSHNEVLIKIYDILGREIEEIFSGYLDKGLYLFSWKPKNISSGTYFYTIQTPNSSITKKMLYLK